MSVKVTILGEEYEVIPCPCCGQEVELDSVGFRTAFIHCPNKKCGLMMGHDVPNKTLSGVTSPQRLLDMTKVGLIHAWSRRA